MKNSYTFAWQIRFQTILLYWRFVGVGRSTFEVRATEVAYWYLMAAGMGILAFVFQKNAELHVCRSGQIKRWKKWSELSSCNYVVARHVDRFLSLWTEIFVRRPGHYTTSLNACQALIRSEAEVEVAEQKCSDVFPVLEVTEDCKKFLVQFALLMKSRAKAVSFVQRIKALTERAVGLLRGLVASAVEI